jgi:hypothetical protein
MNHSAFHRVDPDHVDIGMDQDIHKSYAILFQTAVSPLEQMP